MNAAPRENYKFHHLLAEGNIICDTHAENDEAVIRELCERIARNAAGYDADTLFKEVMLREKIMPTVVSRGLAVPHARIARGENPVIALATSQKGIRFGNDEKPIHAVILLLTPPDDPGLHLQLFAALALDFAKPGWMEELTERKSPQEILQFFTGDTADIPQFLRAKDVMNPTPVTLQENNTLREAIEKFTTAHVDEIPVIDPDLELRGLISLTDLFKFSLPEHILWLDDLSSVYRFQPFSEVLQAADETKVADVMREEFTTVNENIPAVQLAKLFLTQKLHNLAVVDEKNRLTGVVNLQDFFARLFWE